MSVSFPCRGLTRLIPSNLVFFFVVFVKSDPSCVVDTVHCQQKNTAAAILPFFTIGIMNLI